MPRKPRDWTAEVGPRRMQATTLCCSLPMTCDSRDSRHVHWYCRERLLGSTLTM